MADKFMTVVSMADDDSTNLAFVRYDAISIIEQNANPALVTIWTPVDGVLVGDVSMMKNRVNAISNLAALVDTPHCAQDKKNMFSLLLEPHKNLSQIDEYVGVYFSQDEALEYGARHEYTQAVARGDAIAQKMKNMI